MSEEEILEFLRGIESRQIALYYHPFPGSPETPNQLCSGNCRYLASNSWKITIHICECEWDYLMEIEAPDGETVENFSEELSCYEPAPEIVREVYLIGNEE